MDFRFNSRLTISLSTSGLLSNMVICISSVHKVKSYEIVPLAIMITCEWFDMCMGRGYWKNDTHVTSVCLNHRCGDNTVTLYIELIIVS